MKGKKEVKVCPSCSKSFEDYLSNKRSNFCSLPCYWQARKNNKKYAGYWTGKIRLDMQGENNHKWKGNNVSYANLHAWVKKYREKNGVCLHCKENKKTDWANKSFKYKRELDDWLELCRKCHIKYDKYNMGIATKIYGRNQINKYR